MAAAARGFALLLLLAMIAAARLFRLRLEHQSRGRRVRDRDVIIAGDLDRTVADRAARRDPVQYLDPLAARLLDVSSAVTAVSASGSGPI